MDAFCIILLTSLFWISVMVVACLVVCALFVMFYIHHRGFLKGVGLAEERIRRMGEAEISKALHDPEEDARHHIPPSPKDINRGVFTHAAMVQAEIEAKAKLKEGEKNAG